MELLGRTQQNDKMSSSDQLEFEGLEEWRNENKTNQMQTFRYFTHSTSKKHMTTMQHNGVLNPFPTPDKWPAPLSEHGAPKGSWFSMTLYKNNLPTFSPYGEYRVRKEASEMIREIVSNKTYPNKSYPSPRLFLETVVFHTTSGKIKRTVRLILVNRGDVETIEWCKERCNTELDLFNNPFMTIQVDGELLGISKEYDGKRIGQDTPIELKTHKNVGGTPDTWVVLLVPYDVNIAKCKWDNFSEKIPGN